MRYPVIVPANATTFLEVELLDPADEELFLSWWDRAVELLADRGHLAFHYLHVVDRGRYTGVFGFPLPGGWSLISRDHRWHELEEERPQARVVVREARPFRTQGNPRHISTGQLHRWLDERAAGRRDLVLIDALSPESYAARHIPGARNLPARAIDADRARAFIGSDLDTPVVVYCSGYG